MGHVRDLPKSKLGINIENDFEPEYIAIRGKGDLIKELKKEAKQAQKIYLATDPDREGEAISWHLAYLLGIDPASDCRIVFNEITKDTIKKCSEESEAYRSQAGRRSAGQKSAGQTGRISDQPLCCGEKSDEASAPEESSRPPLR